MVIVNVCVSVCILLGVQVQGHGGTDHNLKADTQINPSRLTWKFIHTTYNGHTSAVSALTFSFSRYGLAKHLLSLPSRSTRLLPSHVQYIPYQPSELEKGRMNSLFTSNSLPLKSLPLPFGVSTTK